MKKFLVPALVCGTMLISPAFAFSDVPEDHWAYTKIRQMNQSGIVSGFEDGTFRPDNTITREQAAVIIKNFFELSQKEPAKSFEDLEKGYWSEEYVDLASQYLPITEKDGKYYFRPFEGASRIDVAKAIIKIIGFEDEATDENIINSFKDKNDFSEEDKKYISSAVKNNIMSGDSESKFRPTSTITRAEFCALIYNVYLMRDDLKSQNVDKTVMTINGESISYKTFDLYFKLQRKIYETRFPNMDIWSKEADGISFYDLVKNSTKDGIIVNKVKVQKAKELGIKLNQKTLDDINDYSNSDVGSEICEFYNITKEQLSYINEEGNLIDELAKEIYPTLNHSLHSHVDINKPVQEVKYNVRHILLSDADLSDEEKEEVKISAEELLKRAKSGEDFATLARDYSADAGSKENGGLYEDVAIGEFVPEFEKAALSLSDGMIYPELVKSSYGYHIIKLESKVQTERPLSDDEKQTIMNSDLEEEAKTWVEKSEVNINNEVYKSL